jgi:hypothetical protein
MRGVRLNGAGRDEAGSAVTATAIVIDRMPQDLPFCRFPTRRERAEHGLQPLPDELPLVDSATVRQYRSRRFAPTPASELSGRQVLEMARVVAASFARREPQSRHIQPPRYAPAGVMGGVVVDLFGTEAFGEWSKESLFYWFIRLFVLTDPDSPRTAIRATVQTLEQSLAVVDDAGRVIGGAFNETFPPTGAGPVLRAGDPILSATRQVFEPILVRLMEQDAEALAALCEMYPHFSAMYERRRVGHHFMVARGEALPKRDTFELVAGTAQRYRELGFAYFVVEATNQWTGAACEALGGVRVHYRPFRDAMAVTRSPRPMAGVVTSPDGYIAAKDSGCMFYVLRLA